MNMKMKWLSLFCVLLLAGCGWQTFDRREAYLEAETIERVEIPPGLDQPEFRDALIIPEADDPRQIAGQRVEVGLPEAIGTSFGVDQIVLKRLGDDRWVFVDAPPAMVWPKVRGFFTDNDIPLRTADPARGEMYTEWLAADGADGEAIVAAIKGDGNSLLTPAARTQHQFRVRLEPGIRSGSTEIYLEHKSLPIGSPIRADGVEWDGNSTNEEVEGALLSNIAYFLGDTINTRPAFSAMASNVGTGNKAELVPDRTRPVLKYRLSFDRAWATVGSALESASISVEDLDRSAATFYVYYDATKPRDPGLIRRLLGGGDEERESGTENRYEVKLDAAQDEVHVTVHKNETNLADALIAEQLLKIIKEYST